MVSTIENVRISQIEMIAKCLTKSLIGKFVSHPIAIEVKKLLLSYRVHSFVLKELLRTLL
jgi:hypothetical protein